MPPRVSAVGTRARRGPARHDEAAGLGNEDGRAGPGFFPRLVPPSPAWPGVHTQLPSTRSPRPAPNVFLQRPISLYLPAFAAHSSTAHF